MELRVSIFVISFELAKEGQVGSVGSVLAKQITRHLLSSMVTTGVLLPNFSQSVGVTI